MLTRILREFLRPYRRQVYVALLLLLGQSIANLYLPRLNANLINRGIAQGDTHYIWVAGGYMLAASAGVILASVAVSWVSSRVAMSFGRDLRRRVFQAVEAFSARELGEFGAPTLITRNTNDVQQVQMVLFMGLTMMVSAPITGVGGVVMALHTDLQLSRLLLVSVPVMALFIALLLRRIVPLFRVMQERIDRINLVLREQIGGIRVIRAFVKTDYERDRFAQANHDLMRNTLSVNRTFALMFPTLTLVLNLSSVAVIWFGGHYVDQGSMPIGNLTAFLQYLMQILMSVMMGVMMSLMVPRAATSAERIYAVLDTVPSVADPVHPVEPANRTGLVELRGVGYRYPGAEEPVLHEVSFTARPGKTTAIVGSTGSGKTTVLNLIARFTDVTSGQVLIDGVDVREQPLESVWAQIGLVPQRTYLFGGTVADNVRYGAMGASDDDVWQALDVAAARDFVTALPEQLAAPVAQGGTNFSGGQRQRLSIARAVAKRPKVYLLDDSFSALDFATDAQVRSALESWAAESTLIVVAQRVASIMHADQIVVLDEGRVVGSGRHEDLLESCEVYREIVYSQLSPQEAS